MKKLTKLVIDRKKWGRGTTGGYLLGDGNFFGKTGKMCCLGFYTLACGFTPKEIRAIPLPSEVVATAVDKVLGKGTTLTTAEAKNQVFKDWEKSGINLTALKQVPDKLAGRLATINDDPDTSDEHKEKKITELFKKVGIKVTFVN